MQVLYASFAENQLTGAIPALLSVTVYNVSSNLFIAATFTDLPACELLYVANNSLTGSFPSLSELPANLALMDVSDNQFSGSLPSELPPKLTVLNVSDNILSGQLPSSWSSLSNLVELKLDNNMFTGELPATWSQWGKNSQNSLQLSIVNARLHGSVPQQWVQQFCLSIVRSTAAQVLSRPLPVIVGIVNVSILVGPDIQLTAQHASINVTLGKHFYSFDYNSPGSICGIPNAARNVGLLWGIFAALLVAVIFCVQLLLRRKKRSVSSSTSRWNKLRVCMSHSKLQVPKQVANRLWFFFFDVVFFIYSQVTDIVTIHQVFGSGQLRYAYLLVAVLIFPYVFMLLPVARVTIKLCEDHMTRETQAHVAMAYVAGLLLCPVTLVMLQIDLILHGMGIPVPSWMKPGKVDMYTMHRLQTFAESALNAFPQSVLQSKLYLMGNDPNGVHVYIDTTLFLFSMTGSLASVLKTIAVFSIERHVYNCSLAAYFAQLLKFESVEDHQDFAQDNSIRHLDLVNLSRVDTTSVSSELGVAISKS